MELLQPLGGPQLSQPLGRSWLPLLQQQLVRLLLLLLQQQLLLQLLLHSLRLGQVGKSASPPLLFGGPAAEGDKQQQKETNSSSRRHCNEQQQPASHLYLLPCLLFCCTKGPLLYPKGGPCCTLKEAPAVP